MFWTIEHIKPANYLLVTAEGDFTVEGCIGIKEEFLARDDWNPGMNVLIDYRRTSFEDLNLELLRAIGVFHETKNEEIGAGKMAFLMKSPHDFGLARQYELLTDGKVASRVRVFLDETEAFEWIAAPAYKR